MSYTDILKNNFLILPLALAAAFLTFCTACSKPAHSTPAPEVAALSSRILKVTLNPQGVITANGKTVLLEEFGRILDKLSPESDMVWYYREAGSGVPPANAMEILQSVVNRKLSIRFSIEPDFSDMTPSK